MPRTFRSPVNLRKVGDSNSWDLFRDPAPFQGTPINRSGNLPSLSIDVPTRRLGEIEGLIPETVRVISQPLADGSEPRAETLVRHLLGFSAVVSTRISPSSAAILGDCSDYFDLVHALGSSLEMTQNPF